MTQNLHEMTTRRPYPKEKLGLLIETPAQILNLADYPEQNREDIQVYLHRSIQDSEVSKAEQRTDLKSWLTTNSINA